jgi:hypothetical protein
MMTKGFILSVPGESRGPNALRTRLFLVFFFFFFFFFFSTPHHPDGSRSPPKLGDIAIGPLIRPIPLPTILLGFTNREMRIAMNIITATGSG